jgi:hypothetical protein
MKLPADTPPRTPSDDTILALTPHIPVLVQEALDDRPWTMPLAEAGRFVAEYTGLIWRIERTRILGHMLHHVATREPFWQLALSERPYAHRDGPGRFIPLGAARTAPSAEAARDFLMSRFALSAEPRRLEIPVRVTVRTPSPTS